MFELSESQKAKVDEWLHTRVYPPILEEQRKDPEKAPWLVTDSGGRTYPYFGAIGGELTFQFTPTSIGSIIKVIHCTGEQLDLTDYDSW